MKGAERKAFTKDVQVVFQDPYSSLDPKMRVIDIVSEGLISHNLVSGNAEKKEAVQELLKLVGLRVNMQHVMCMSFQEVKGNELVLLEH